MQLYTKVGDKGMTQLIGGGKVSKDSDRVWAYGTVDELNSFIGLTVAEIESQETIRQELIQLQSCLFDLGTDLANPKLDQENDAFDDKYIDWIESRIDAYQDEPEEITQFILPGGSKQAALLQVCRTITRRLERQVVTLNRSVNLPAKILIFINRLSDYFYALARVMNYRLDKNEIFYEHGNRVFH